MTEFPADASSSSEAVSATTDGSSSDFTPLDQGDLRPDPEMCVPGLNSAVIHGLTVGVLVLLYLLGLVHWCWFLNFGDIPWNLIDWPKERAYCDVLQQTFQQGKVPFHISSPYHGTDRFLGNPEINLSPQVVLLAFVDPGTYMLLNILVLYSAGFVGLLMIRNRFHLGLVAFAAFWLLFNFSGHITSHLAASHPMWAGYFLLPFFLLWLLEWSEDGPSSALVGKLSLVLFAIFLQGSFHLGVWCWMFVALFTAFNPRWWKSGLAIIGLSGLLMTFRILPGVVAFWGVKGHPVLPGYSDIWEMVVALAVIHDGSEPAKTIAAGPLFWWEYDMYIGLVGLALMVWFGIGTRWLDRSREGGTPEPASDMTPFARWDGPILVLAFLTLNPYWSVIAALPLPLISSERVPSRFLVLPVLMLILIAVIRLNDWLRRVPRTAFLIALVICGLAELTRGLIEHSIAWHMSGYSDTVKGMIFQQPQMVEIVQRPDPVYIGSIFLGLAISGITAVTWWWWIQSESVEGGVQAEGDS